MGVACVYCRGGFVAERPAPYGLCPPCHALLEDELTAAAVRAARPARHDAEPLPEFILPDGWAPPAVPTGATGSD